MRSGGENGLYAGVMRLPGADEKADFELRLAGVSGARADDPEGRRTGPVRKAAVAPERRHQVVEQQLIIDVDPQSHLPTIVDAPPGSDPDQNVP